MQSNLSWTNSALTAKDILSPADKSEHEIHKSHQIVLCHEFAYSSGILQHFLLRIEKAFGTYLFYFPFVV